MSFCFSIPFEDSAQFRYGASLGLGEKDWPRVVVIPHRPTIRQRRIISDQMSKAAIESPFDVCNGNVVPAFSYSLPHTCNRDRRI